MKKVKQSPQDIARTITEFRILQALEEASHKRLRWKDLKKETAAEIKSSRTLADRLKTLEMMGLVRRVVDQSVYPPAVVYERTAKAWAITRNKKVFDKFQETIKKERENDYAILKHLVDTYSPKESAEKAVEATVEDLIMQILHTLRYAIENPNFAPGLIYLSAEGFSSTLSHLIELFGKNPDMVKAIQTVQSNIKEERKKEYESFFDNIASSFKDKALAKAIIKVYSVQLALGKTNVKLPVFAEEVKHNQTLFCEVEKFLGAKLDLGRLNVIIKDHTWTMIEKKRKTL